MTFTNGDVSTGILQLALEQKILDHTKAVELLRDEYSNSDGLDAKTLLDSRINGGLTYNDFLVLPGYIGTVLLLMQGSICTEFFRQALLRQMWLWIRQSPSEYPSRVLWSPLPWTL